MGKEKQNLVGKYPTITSFAIILFCNSDQKKRGQKKGKAERCEKRIEKSKRKFIRDGVHQNPWVTMV